MKSLRNTLLTIFACALTIMLFSISIASSYGIGKGKLNTADIENINDSEEISKSEKNDTEVKSKKLKVISDDDICHEIAFINPISFVKYKLTTTHTSTIHSGFDKFVYSPPEF
ncbi:MAG: hypothetical protein JNL69_05145 [Bacteroidia bacterium]|nr:hypothetical protein [Bacteroidia bacterium]